MSPPQVLAMQAAQESFDHFGELHKRLLVAETLKQEYEKVMRPTNQRLVETHERTDAC
jgi:hypothetical protein